MLKRKAAKDSKKKTVSFSSWNKVKIIEKNDMPLYVKRQLFWDESSFQEIRKEFCKEFNDFFYRNPGISTENLSRCAKVELIYSFDDPWTEENCMTF
jgi:hypothetical protein